MNNGNMENMDHLETWNSEKSKHGNIGKNGNLEDGQTRTIGNIEHGKLTHMENGKIKNMENGQTGNMGK